jgi:hypothetical protein
MNKALLDLLECNVNGHIQSKLKKSPDRIIRYNKHNKERSENIKVREVIKALKVKKHYTSMFEN